MFRLLTVATIVCMAGVSASAQDFAQIPNTYHVQVRIEHWRIGTGYWSTEFTTNDQDEALLMLDLFELALEEHALREMLGLSWEWLTTDVRLQTEYAWQTQGALLEARPLYRDSSRTYQAPSYQWAGN